MFVPSDSTVPKLQTAEDLQGDALLHYDAEIEVMTLILLSIPNDIYNSVDAFTFAKDMWKRVERLMRGTIQNKVDRETRFINEFDQFVAEPGESLFSVYNRFAQLMNDLERNDMHFLIVTINTKNTSSYYMTHPTSVVDYDDKYQQDDIQTNSEDPLTSAMTLWNSSSENTSTLNATAVGEKDTMQGIVQSQEFGTRNTSWNKCCWENRMKLNANICLMVGIQPTNHSSDVGQAMILLSTIGDDQIDRNIIFNTPNENVNSGSVEKDTHVPDLCVLEQLTRNEYQEAEKQQIFAQKVQKQNKTLNSQLELYKERVWVLENINEDNNYLNEFLKADQSAKHFDQQAQS
nr:hypothetical protein [Tanacetum cinerariifolium]